MKILVLGYLEGKKEDYIKKAKQLGLNTEDIVFCLPEHFDVRDIKNSEYSDFILGCSPHNMKGVNGGALIHQIKSNPSIYPKLHTSAEHRMTLKLSITMFKKFLLESRYLETKK